MSPLGDALVDVVRTALASTKRLPVVERKSVSDELALMRLDLNLSTRSDR